MLKVKTFVFNFIQENTYVVYDDESLEAVIIDAGNYSLEEDALLFGFIEGNGLKVTRLLNTHTHLDHIMGNKACKEKFALTPEIHELDLLTFEKMVQTSMIWGVDLTTSPLPVATLKAGDEIILGKEKLLVLFTRAIAEAM